MKPCTFTVDGVLKSSYPLTYYHATTSGGDLFGSINGHACAVYRDHRGGTGGVYLAGMRCLKGPLGIYSGLIITYHGPQRYRCDHPTAHTFITTPSVRLIATIPQMIPGCWLYIGLNG